MGFKLYRRAMHLNESSPESGSNYEGTVVPANIQTPSEQSSLQTSPETIFDVPMDLQTVVAAIAGTEIARIKHFDRRTVMATDLLFKEGQGEAEMAISTVIRAALRELAKLPPSQQPSKYSALDSLVKRHVGEYFACLS